MNRIVIVIRSVIITLLLCCCTLVGQSEALNIEIMPSSNQVAPSTDNQINALERPIVTLTFDDGWESVFEIAAPLLKDYQYPVTFYLNTGALGQPRRFTNEQVGILKKAGHEIAAHTVTHPHLNTLSPQEVEKELSESKNILEKLTDAPVIDFASPFGDANEEVIALIKKYFQSNRTVLPGYNSKYRFDPYQIRVQNVSVKTTPEKVEEWLDWTVQNRVWLVFAYHQVDNKGAPYSASPEDFKKHLEAIKKRGLTVLTMEQALKEVSLQIK